VSSTLAHIAGLPAEELIPLVYGAAGLWAVARVLPAKLAARARRSFPDEHRGPERDGGDEPADVSTVDA
jgi:hypothetical protein